MTDIKLLFRQHRSCPNILCIRRIIILSAFQLELSNELNSNAKEQLPLSLEM